MFDFEGYIDLPLPSLPEDLRGMTYLNSTVTIAVTNSLNNTFYVYLLREAKPVGTLIKDIWTYDMNFENIRIISMFSSSLGLTITSRFQHCVPVRIPKVSELVSPRSIAIVIGILYLFILYIWIAYK